VSGDPVAALVARADPPLYIVTTAAGGERAGCLVGFAGQVSIEPPRFLAALSVANRTWDVARSATHLAVHVFGRGHMDLIELFGGETGDDVDKFDRCAWSDGPAGIPVLEGASAWFVGRILARHDFGDHVGHVLEPIAGAAAAPAAPDDAAGAVRLHDAHGLHPGHPA
jgi:flavin reductase (DIM6/NTAB) family NADH-FMN oxidoreductase RutF